MIAVMPTVAGSGRSSEETESARTVGAKAQRIAWRSMRVLMAVTARATSSEDPL